MTIPQISVFLENKPGRLNETCRLLAEAGINILTVSLADTRQFGILRLIVKDWQKAKETLEKAGCVLHVSQMVAVEVDDRPGGLAEALAVFEKHKINIEYMYAFTFRKKGKAVILFSFSDMEKALAALQQHKAPVLSAEKLFAIVE